MASYSRSTRSSQSQAGELFEQLLSSELPPKPSNMDSCHDTVRETTPPAERTWSRRKYEYSFSPGSKAKSTRHKKISPTKPTKRKASAPDISFTEPQTNAPKVPKLELSDKNSTVHTTCPPTIKRSKANLHPERPRKFSANDVKGKGKSKVESRSGTSGNVNSKAVAHKRTKDKETVKPEGKIRTRRSTRNTDERIQPSSCEEDDKALAPRLKSGVDSDYCDASSQPYGITSKVPSREEDGTSEVPAEEDDNKNSNVIDNSKTRDIHVAGMTDECKWMDDSQVTPEQACDVPDQQSCTEHAQSSDNLLTKQGEYMTLKTKSSTKSSSHSSKNSKRSKSKAYKSPLDELFESPKKTAPDSPLHSYHSNTENPLIKIKKSSPIRRMREEKSESKWDSFVTQSVPPPVSTIFPGKLQVPKPSLPQKSKFKPSRVYSLVTRVPKDSPGAVSSASSQHKTSSSLRGGGKGAQPSPAKPSPDNQVTMVRNVMSAHECVQSGQNQQFFDDCRYLLESLRPTTALKSRCLGALNLANQLLEKEFSQQFRAQGFANKIFNFLQDCLKYPVLVLSAAVLYYCLTRDPLSSQWNSQLLDVLYSMLSLTELSIDDSNARIKNKCSSVLKKSRPQGTPGDEPSESRVEYHLDPQNYSVCDLARECLISLSSPHHNTSALQRELRAVGALDSLANNAIECTKQLLEVAMASPDGDIEEKCTTLNRWLKLIDNCCAMCSDNQTYLVVFDGSVLVTTLVKLLRGCFRSISAGELLLCEVLLSVLRILLNLTHNNELCCDRVGSEEHIFSALLRCVLQSPACLSKDQQFEITAAALGVLINLTEHNTVNRDHLENTPVDDVEDSELIVESPGGTSSLIALVEMFSKFYNKAESTDIVMPSPQRLSQLSNSPSQPSPSHQPPQPSTARRNLTSAINTKASNKAGSVSAVSNSPEKASSEQESQQSSDGLSWLPEHQESEESDSDEDIEAIETDPLVFSRKEFDTALSQAGRHLEDSIIASYCALLIGILVHHNTSNVDSVRECVPSKSFTEMIGMLGKFISFMSMTGSTTGLDSIKTIKSHLQDLSKD